MLFGQHVTIMKKDRNFGNNANKMTSNKSVLHVDSLHQPQLSSERDSLGCAIVGVYLSLVTDYFMISEQ